MKTIFPLWLKQATPGRKEGTDVWLKWKCRFTVENFKVICCFFLDGLTSADCLWFTPVFVGRADAINLSGTLVSKQDFKHSTVGKLAFGL